MRKLPKVCSQEVDIVSVVTRAVVLIVVVCASVTVWSWDPTHVASDRGRRVSYCTSYDKYCRNYLVEIRGSKGN